MVFNDAAVLGHNTKRNHGIMESWMWIGGVSFYVTASFTLFVATMDV